MDRDWIEIELKDVCEIYSGFGFPKIYQGKRTGKYPFYKVGDISKNVQQGHRYLVHCNNYIDDEVLNQVNGKLIPKGTIVFAKIGEALKLNRRAITSTICLIDNNAIGVKSRCSMLEGFLFYKFLTIKLEGYSRATTVPSVRKSDIETIKIALPPLPIQRAIVSKIEQLFSELDNGIQNLKQAKGKIEVFRQAVLKKAFEGELTKNWREKHEWTSVPNDILGQINEERQRHYELQVRKWKKAIKVWEQSEKKVKKPSRISKPKKFPEIKDDDIDIYEKIPDSWTWARLGNVTYKIGDIDHKMPKTVKNGLPYLSTGNIGSDGTIDFENAKRISKEDFERLSLKIKPEKGDIIFPRYGTIGRNILIDTDKEFLVSYSCAIIKNIKPLIEPKFVLYYSLSPVVKKEIENYIVQTTQANIGISSLELFVFPLCSKIEQNQIVQEIESRLSACDEMEKSIESSLKKAEALRQSILKKAFSGELLSEEEIEACKQESDWETAEVLLEKIKNNSKT